MWLVLALGGEGGGKKASRRFAAFPKLRPGKKQQNPALHTGRDLPCKTFSRIHVSSLMGRCCITLIKVVKKTTNPNAKGTCT